VAALSMGGSLNIIAPNVIMNGDPFIWAITSSGLMMIKLLSLFPLLGLNRLTAVSSHLNKKEYDEKNI